MAVRRNVPFYRKLGRHVIGAAKQLDAGNPEHDKPNIIVFVSHTPEIDRRDLIATIAGLPVPGGPPLFMLGKKMQGQVCDGTRKIDLFLWIDATARTCQHLTAPDAKPVRTGIQSRRKRKVAGSRTARFTGDQENGNTAATMAGLQSERLR